MLHHDDDQLACNGPACGAPAGRAMMLQQVTVLMVALGLVAGVAAATIHVQHASPPPPPGCEGTQCRRAKCGDICTETDCSHFGNVCAGGVQAPAGPGWTYSSKFAAPELPSSFTSENATIFYYFNLVRLEKRCPYSIDS